MYDIKPNLKIMSMKCLIKFKFGMEARWDFFCKTNNIFKKLVKIKHLGCF